VSIDLAEIGRAVLPGLRIPLGLILVLFVPGASLIAAAFPRLSDLGLAERIGLSIGASVGVVAVLAPLLDRLGLGLRPDAILVAELVVSGACLAVAVARRATIAELRRGGLRSAARSWARWPPRRSWPLRDVARVRPAVPVAILLLSAVAATAAGVILVSRPTGRPETSFYVVNPGGGIGNYPYQLTAGREATVRIGITNGTDRRATYHFEIWSLGPDGVGQPARLLTSPPIEVEPGAADEQLTSWRMAQVGSDELVKILLFEGSDSSPARELRLWLDVVRPSPTE
jgi:uncharacterized membrane protein